MILREINILEKINSSFIAKYFGFVKISYNYYLIFEYVEFCLADFLKHTLYPIDTSLVLSLDQLRQFPDFKRSRIFAIN